MTQLCNKASRRVNGYGLLDISKLIKLLQRSTYFLLCGGALLSYILASDPHSLTSIRDLCQHSACSEKVGFGPLICCLDCQLRIQRWGLSSPSLSS